MSLIEFTNYSNVSFLELKKIPSEWNLLRIKDLVVKISSGVTPKGGSETYLDKGIPFIRSQNVYDDGLRLSKVSYIGEEVNLKMKNSQLKPLDILINITGASIGRSCIVPLDIKNGNINQHVVSIRTKKKHVPFLSYYLKSNSIKEYINKVQLGSSKEALNMGQILNFPVPLPPLTEQTQIANYLEEKTAAIDQKIKLLKKKCNTYKELRESLINETVCKGLNKNAKLSDSGIDYIGTIPEHWEMKRLKDIGYLFSGLSGKSGTDFNQENNLLNQKYIPFTTIFKGNIIDTTLFENVVINNNENQNKVKLGDIFFLMSSEGYEDIGKCSLLNDQIEDTYLNSFCKGFRITQTDILPIYLNYLLLSEAIRHQVITEGKGFTRINLKMSKINNQVILVPPISEQKEIVAYLDAKTSKIDSIITNIKTQIETLTELRKTLINDLVTGKLKIVKD